MLLASSISEFPFGDAIVETALCLYLRTIGEYGSKVAESYLMGEVLLIENFLKPGVHEPEYFYSIILMIK